MSSDMSAFFMTALRSDMVAILEERKKGIGYTRCGTELVCRYLSSVATRNRAIRLVAQNPTPTSCDKLQILTPLLQYQHGRRAEHAQSKRGMQPRQSALRRLFQRLVQRLVPERKRRSRGGLWRILYSLSRVFTGLTRGRIYMIYKLISEVATGERIDNGRAERWHIRY